MSMILDALRKSEAERRRGQTPDLLTETAPVPASARPSTRDPRTLTVIGAAALVSVLLVFWWLRSGTKPQANSEATAPARIEEAGPDTTARQAALPPLQPPQARSPRASSTPPVSMPQRERAEPAAAALPSPPASSLPSSPQASARAIPPREAAAEDIALPVTPPASPAAVPATTSAAAFSSPDAPLRLADLSSEERRQLPALKLSMHMWAPDAAGRFAIIDGTRVNEGDRIGDAVVETIEADGVLLSWRGRRIRLPIR